MRGVEEIKIGKYYKGNNFLAKIKRNISLLCRLLKLGVRRFLPNDVIFILILYNLHFQRIFYKLITYKKVDLYLIMIDLEIARNNKYND